MIFPIPTRIFEESNEGNYDIAESTDPHFIQLNRTETQLNDLVCDLNLSKAKAELVGYRLES